MDYVFVVRTVGNIWIEAKRGGAEVAEGFAEVVGKTMTRLSGGWKVGSMICSLRVLFLCGYIS